MKSVDRGSVGASKSRPDLVALHFHNPRWQKLTEGQCIVTRGPTVSFVVLWKCFKNIRKSQQIR